MYIRAQLRARVVATVNRFKIFSQFPTTQIKVFLTVPSGASAMVDYFCHCMSLHVCAGKILILDSRLAYVWERNCPFGSLLVVF